MSYAKQSIYRSSLTWLTLILFVLVVLLGTPLTALASGEIEDTTNWRFMEENTWEYHGSFEAIPRPLFVYPEQNWEAMRFLEENLWDVEAPHLAVPQSEQDELLTMEEILFIEMNVWDWAETFAHVAGWADQYPRISIFVAEEV